jgi:hypothetical protein
MISPFSRSLATSGCLALMLLQGCGEPEQPKQQIFIYGLPDELKEIDIGYLPYRYLDDGCYARASYLGMELAIRSIPSTGITLQSCDYSMSLEGPAGFAWRFHVNIALMEGASENPVPRIIEPYLADRFITADEWRASMKVDDNYFFAYSAPAYAGPIMGEDLACYQTYGQEHIAWRMDQMTPWLGDNLLYYCATLRQFWRDSPDYSPEKEARLVERTHELYLALKAANLIDQTFVSPDMALIEEGPYCPEPVPK